MAVTPDDSDRIVALSLHISRVHIFRHFVDLQDLTTVDLINASGASTFYPELIRVDRFADFGLLGAGSLRALIKMLFY